MFIDTAKIFLKAGKGGDGAVSFHREKYVAAGGPDGGDGGRGGNIVFVADPNLSTLMDFRAKRKYAAPCGAHGRGGFRRGYGARARHARGGAGGAHGGRCPPIQAIERRGTAPGGKDRRIWKRYGSRGLKSSPITA